MILIFDFGSQYTQLIARKIRQLSVKSEIVPFDEPLAREAARLRRSTREQGLSLGDRACLALGLSRGLPVLTADRAWSKLPLKVRVVQIR